MSAIISKATGFVNNIASKSTKLANTVTYWSKVGAELGKTVYKQEGLAPPNVQQFQQVYQNAVKFVKSSSQQQAFLEKVSQFQPNRANGIKAAVYGTHLLAFFSIGEIIGRRKIVGYPSFGHAEHH